MATPESSSCRQPRHAKRAIDGWPKLKSEHVVSRPQGLAAEVFEVRGRVDVDFTFLEFDRGDVVRPRFDQRFRTGIVGQREQRIKTGTIKERGNAERFCITGSNHWLSAFFLLRDEGSDGARFHER